METKELITPEEMSLPNGSCCHLAMRPSIIQDEPNQDLPVYDGNIIVNDSGVESEEYCRVWCSCVPSIRINFEVPQPTRQFASGRIKLKIQEASEAEALILSSGQGLGQGFRFLAASGILLTPIVFGGNERLGRVRFHLFNFLDYRGKQIYCGPEKHLSWWTGRVQFSLGEWLVTLDALKDLSGRIKQTRAVEGFAVTHVGNIERSDGKLFGEKEASLVLEALYYIFSFAGAARCGCMLAFGYRYMPTEVARWAYAYRIASAPSEFYHTWFDKHRPEESFQFANKLFELIMDDGEKAWITSAISFYLESNRNISGTEIELSKSQIALELLTWEVAQEHQQLLTRESFERLPASDKIRLALLWAGISPSIPQEMKELHVASTVLKQKEQPYDGPFVITQIRNATIHATRSKRSKIVKLDELARYQAWQLSQHYAELLILRLLNYNGTYRPRWDEAAAEGYPGRPVPWS